VTARFRCCPRPLDSPIQREQALVLNMSLED
jgi:hypothetical protein